MYRMTPQKGRFVPVILCDECERTIGDASMGNILWSIGADGEPADGVIYHVHKECDAMFRRRQASVTFYWEGLDLHLYRIQHNTKLNTKKALEAIKTLATIG